MRKLNQQRLPRLRRVFQRNTPELVIREGRPAPAIESLIEDDHDIALMILAAGDANEGPGPLVSAIAGSEGSFSIPVTVVPNTLTDQDIDDLV